MPKSTNLDGDFGTKDPLGSPEELMEQELPPGLDRRTFMMRTALISAMGVISGTAVSAQEKTKKAIGRAGSPPEPALSPNLNVVKEQKGPVMTVLDEFYKVGPGPSSSHTIGPMRVNFSDGFNVNDYKMQFSFKYDWAKGFEF